MTEPVASGFCINCGQSVETSYCPNCGQKNPPKKITLISLYTDFQSRIYGFDGMFPRTFRDLTIRPGKVATIFNSGNRVKYYGPVGYFFLMVTLFILLMSLLNIDFYEFSQATSSFGQAVKQGSSQEKVTRNLTTMMSGNMRTFSFLLIPIFAFWMWIFFRKSGNNFLETASLVFFVNGHFFWVSMILLVVYKITGGGIDSFFMILLSAVYFAFAATGFYTYQRKAVVFIKAIFAWITAYIFFIIIFVAAFMAYFLLDKEALEMLKESAR